MNNYQRTAESQLENIVMVYEKNRDNIIYANKQGKCCFQNQTGEIIFQDIFKDFDFDTVQKEISMSNPLKKTITIVNQQGIQQHCDVEITQADENKDVYVFDFEIEVEDVNEAEDREIFLAMQNFTEDLLYCIDVETMTLHYVSKAKNLEKYGSTIENYVDVLISDKIIHPDDCQRYIQGIQNTQNANEELTIRFSLHSENYIWYTVKRKEIFDKQGNLVKIYGKLVNVQREKELETEYSVLNQYFSAMQELTDDFIYRVDVETMTLYHSHEGSRLAPYKLGMPDHLNTLVKEKLVHPEDAEQYINDVTEWYSDKRDVITARFVLDGDEYKWYSIKSKKLYDSNGEFKEIFGRMRNIQLEKDLERKATQDLLTEVYNKTSFAGNISEFLKEAEVGQKHALLFIDLDDFKGVNDTFGHMFGDVLLSTVGKRLKRIVRDIDYVGRIGGDEFAIFLKNVDSEDAVIERGKILLESLHRKFGFEGKSMKIRASVGIAIFPEHGESYDELLKCSDIALYHAKGKGKDLVTMYQSGMKDGNS